MSNMSHVLAFAILYFFKLPAISSYAAYRSFLPRIALTTNFYAPSSSLSSSSPLSSLSSSSSSSSSSSQSDQTPLIDLQTFLKLTNLVDSGGKAKTTIQSGECLLNDQIESRRAKKLFPGDVVSLTTDASSTQFDVAYEVSKRGYVYKIKTKKVKPVARIDEDGNKEFGGRFRSDDWRAERKVKKEERKMKNKRQVLKNED